MRIGTLRELRYPWAIILALLTHTYAQAQDSPSATTTLHARRAVTDRPSVANVYALEWGTLYHHRGVPQIAGKMRLDGNPIGDASGFRFYALQANQRAFQGLQGTFDQANYYYLSHTATHSGRSISFGITHDKASVSNASGIYRYNKGGLELTLMLGRHFCTKRTLLGRLRGYAEYRGGLFLSLNDVNAAIETSIDRQPILLTSQARGRAFAGMGMLGGGGLGLNWRFTPALSLSLGMSATVMGGYTRERVTLNGAGNHRLRIGYAALLVCYPVVKLCF
jgi:hypothetical protein